MNTGRAEEGMLDVHPMPARHAETLLPGLQPCPHGRVKRYCTDCKAEVKEEA